MSFKIKCLVLCTTEKEDKERPSTLKKLSPKEKNQEPILENLEAGYLMRSDQQIIYKTFSIFKPLIWREEVTKWCNQFLPNNHIEKIKINSANVEAIKLFCKLVLPFKKTTTLILSKISYQALLEVDPKYLNKINFDFISEEMDFENKIKTEQENKEMASRLIEVAKSTSISPLERKLYLFLFGKQLISLNTKHLSYVVFDREKIAKEFTQGLQISLKDVIKSIDKLRKKALISIFEKNNDLYFMIKSTGPVDLI